jgi:hypothetical protein
MYFALNYVLLFSQNMISHKNVPIHKGNGINFNLGTKFCIMWSEAGVYYSEINAGRKKEAYWHHLLPSLLS